MQRLPHTLHHGVCLLLLALVFCRLVPRCYGLDCSEALQSGLLWRMGPAELWETFLQEDQGVYTIHGDILLTGQKLKPEKKLHLDRGPLPRSFWFWESACSPQDWARAWNSDRELPPGQRRELLSACKGVRLRRISVMLYRAAEDKKEYAHTLSDYTEQLNACCGAHGQEQPKWTDAAGRRIQTMLWEMGESVVMLELATVKGETDYVRLTFAAGLADLYYKRTAMDHIATGAELKARVKHLESSARLEGIPCFTHLSRNTEQAYTPGWFEALCYYGLHDIDNYSERADKTEYPGKYTKIELRRKQQSKKLYTLFTRSLQSRADLKDIEPTEAEEIFVLDNYAEEADDWWSRLRAYLDVGLPIVYEKGKEGYLLTAYREKPGEKAATNTRYGAMSFERCFMQPHAVYVILPGDSQAPAAPEQKP